MTFNSTGDGCETGEAALSGAVDADSLYYRDEYTCSNDKFESLDTGQATPLCGAGAVCTDASFPYLFPIKCECSGDAYPNPLAESGVAPYTVGCLTPRNAASVMMMSEAVMFDLRKTTHASMQGTQQLTISKLRVHIGMGVFHIEPSGGIPLPPVS